MDLDEQQDDIQINDSNINGWRFCDNCNNLLVPIKQQRDKETDLDKDKIKNRSQYLIKRTVLEQKKATDIFNKQMILDPSMQRKQITCPECGYNEAVFYLKTDLTQPKIIIQYICAKKEGTIIKCGATWNKYDTSQDKDEQDEELEDQQELNIDNDLDQDELNDDQEDDLSDNLFSGDKDMAN
ncbi:hypothetical protein PPERSA_01753 [Pseudocohnilembus persalinus]|uniref:TFIIS-type domain-containing protein n=1 Tax=Pseudocohnilembus persalinus TaxID=266149 RepID=A0A0V0R198_PSEPJ|nr:hypothetical protein PPERSA_01753 [Pseudocohnilembus persalinus]|eukprot:KRX08292.1 hypothetical protein PPERSA_01753 [Pseudocohnilembus persalinus]